MENEQTYRTQVQSILEEIRAANITLGNFKKYQDKVNSTEQIIRAQIESNKSDYQELKRQYDEAANKQSFKDQYDGGIVPAEMYDLIKRMNRMVQATYGWKSIQLELNTALIEKMAEILGETKALDIERDALNRFNEMTVKEHDFFKNIMERRFNLLEEKFNLFMGAVTDKMNEERKLMLKTLQAFAPMLAKSMPGPIVKLDVPKQDIAPPEKPFEEQRPQDIQTDGWAKIERMKTGQQDSFEDMEGEL